jgi:hypothetical protein
MCVVAKVAVQVLKGRFEGVVGVFPRPERSETPETSNSTRVSPPSVPRVRLEGADYSNLILFAISNTRMWSAKEGLGVAGITISGGEGLKR